MEEGAYNGLCECAEHRRAAGVSLLLCDGWVRQFHPVVHFSCTSRGLQRLLVVFHPKRLGPLVCVYHFSRMYLLYPFLHAPAGFNSGLGWGVPQVHCHT
jgi:hypothetical protein